MISIHINENHQIKTFGMESFLDSGRKREDVLWIDILSPSDEELKWVGDFFSIEFPTRQESEEIEMSSRYWEENDEITINTYFLVYGKETTYNETATFILKGKLLVTLRYLEFNSFNRCVKKLMANPRYFESNFSIFNEIFESRIDNDADTLEFIATEISNIGRSVINDAKSITEKVFTSISYFEELNMSVRENLIDKQRILSTLMKNVRIDREVRDEIRIMLKDVLSLVDYTNFNFQRMGYLQNNYLGLINIEQNKVIKMFTIVSVALMPPTLIASIYGMNFHNLPELSWDYGYYLSLFMMLVTGIAPLLYFKKKGWY